MQHSRQNEKLNSKAPGKWIGIIICCLIAVILTVLFYDYIRSRSVANSQTYAQVFEQSFTASIKQYSYLPALISRSLQLTNLLSEVHSSHKSLSDELLSIAEESGASAIYLINEHGTVVASSNHNKPKAFYGKNYAFRPYFKLAMESARQQYYYAKGATSGIPGFFISYPVKRNNAVLGVVVVKLDLRSWEAQWKQSGLNIFVADQNGIIILSSNDAWRYKISQPLQGNVLQQVINSKQYLNENHQLIYDRQRSVYLSRATNYQNWQMAEGNYLVSRYSITDPDWHFFYLQDDKKLLTNALFFFAATLGALLLANLFIQE